MARVYVFADETGNFDFSVKPGATKYFILGTVTISDCSVGTALMDLRRELAWQGVGLESTFHATEDQQVIRDAVFGVLTQADIRADFTLFEKRKTVPRRQSEAGLYKLAWYEHFKHVAPKIAKSDDELLVTAASMGTRKRRREFRVAIEDVVVQSTRATQWEVAFWSCESDPCLQIADYYAWALGRKYESGDSRSYDLIQHQIRSEYDYFSWGSKYYY